jgi:hypothetical protein
MSEQQREEVTTTQLAGSRANASDMYLGDTQFESLLGQQISWFEVLRGFPQSLEQNVGKIPQLGHYSFLPYIFPFIVLGSRENRFLFCTACGPIPLRPLSNGYRGLFLWGLSCRAVKLTTHLHLVPNLRICEDISPLSHKSSRRGD